ncbi:MAG: hypothetical protein PVJ67_06395 [Candidatus Pacearchaeota archaeon]|jgi:hypothetical protein
MANLTKAMEEKIRKITHLYYSRRDVQKAIFEFSKNREISPRYFEGFGKRPDSFQYLGDIFELVKKGATSFNCSEELWENPLEIETGMTEGRANDLRIGWDLLIDIDCQWFDYSKLAAKIIIEVLNEHGVKNIGLKFSGSKGWHILVPWKSFPENIGEEKTKNLFPDLPKKIISYIEFEAEKKLRKNLPDNFHRHFKNTKIKKGIRCLECSQIAEHFKQVEFHCQFCRISEHRKIFNYDNEKKYFCPQCKRELIKKSEKEISECSKCNSTSDNFNKRKKLGKFSEVIEEDLFELMGLDILLVSPRHLFRTPYSLHEKTALASVVINPEEIDSFEFRNADPMKVVPKNFMPTAKEGEARELVMQALDWTKENEVRVGETQMNVTGKYVDYKPIKLDEINKENFPPCLKNILNGLVDGKKRALFVMINLFRSIGMESEEMEKRIFKWNKKNNPPLKEGYITTQLSWAYKKKPIMPSNCKEFYQGIGVCAPDEFCSRIKNPASYVIKKSLLSEKKKKEKK